MCNGIVTDCISLNSNIVSICNSSNILAIACRIGYNGGGTFYTNYTDKSVVVKIGRSESDLSNVVAYGDNHGQNLNRQPIDLLNSWVTANATTEHPYLPWEVIEGVNNGYPVSADRVSVAFETNEGLAINPATVTYVE